MSCRAHRGFTIIELMVAMAVAALLFAALIFGLGALTGARARQAMGELGACLGLDFLGDAGNHAVEQIDMLVGIFIRAGKE